MELLVGGNSEGLEHLRYLSWLVLLETPHHCVSQLSRSFNRPALDNGLSSGLCRLQLPKSSQNVSQLKLTGTVNLGRGRSTRSEQRMEEEL